jgi:hypothetical protein
MKRNKNGKQFALKGTEMKGIIKIMKKSELLNETKINKKIKDLDLDLQIKILDANILNKQTKAKDRNYDFYLEISNLLEQAQKILSDKYRKKTSPDKGLLSLLREKSGLNGLNNIKMKGEKRYERSIK